MHMHSINIYLGNTTNTLFLNPGFDYRLFIFGNEAEFSILHWVQCVNQGATEEKGNPICGTFCLISALISHAMRSNSPVRNPLECNDERDHRLFLNELTLPLALHFGAMCL